MLGLLRRAERLVHHVRAFRRGERGNVAIIVAFAMIPMVGLVGLATDYGVALTTKSKLDNSADAAALAAVAGAKAYVAANPTDTNLTADAIAQGLNLASRSFTVNAGNLPYSTIPIPVTSNSAAPSTNTCGQASACIYLTKNGQTFTSTVYYRTTTQNNFGPIVGQKTMNVLGSSSASAQIPSYIDFYLLVDVSGSMGLPATSSGQSSLAAANGGCQFACHFPGQTSGYNYALNNNIQLRSGAVNSAVCSLLVLASTPLVQHQYRVGIFPFIDQMATLANASYADPAPTVVTPSSNALWNSAGCVPTLSAPYYQTSNPAVFTSLLDTGTTQLYTGNNPSTGTGSGGTHFESIFSSVQSNIINFGTGATAATSRPFVFLITDGMQNSQHYAWNSKGTYYYPGNPSTFNGYTAAQWDGSSPAYMDYTKCAALKSAGVTISVLYIPYTYLTVGSQNQTETIAADNALSSIPGALQSCASPGFYTQANTPADINTALQNMFQQAVQVSHLIQ